MPGQKHGYDLAERFALFCSLYQVNKKARSYTLDLLTGITENLDKIDDLIVQVATNWRLSRLAATDRNLLRVAVYEMVHRDDVPAQVAMNEAVEIAKKFAGDESPKFINGILDAVNTKLSSD